jgi:hypothetical protein
MNLKEQWGTSWYRSIAGTDVSVTMKGGEFHNQLTAYESQDGLCSKS